MSQVQWQEEQDYNRDDSAHLEALRADHHDPYEYTAECETHGESFDIRTSNCSQCPTFLPKTKEEIWLDEWADIPPF